MLQALSALQLEVSSHHEVNHGAYIQFMCMNHLRRKHHLGGRIAILQGISGFWLKALSFLLLLGVSLSGRGGRRRTGAGARPCMGVAGEGWVWDKGIGREQDVPEGSVVLGCGRLQRESRVESGQRHTCKCHSHDSGVPLQACVRGGPVAEASRSG